MRRASAIPGKLQAADHLLKNLRLLDLDEAFDLPVLSRDTFTSSSPVSAQTDRVYAAQWILYRLFERYDPWWTASSLSPYFPPLESKQSSELKLHFFKRLSELKQSGHFPKDVTLRRTMFDDCKGPRFEELLYLLSTLVLAHGFSADGSVSSQICAGSYALRKDLRAPLLLAYRSSMSNISNERAVRESRFLALGRALAARRRELDERSEQINAAGAPYRAKGRALPQRTLDRLEKTVRDSWVGDAEWAETMLRGEGQRPRREFVERDFSEIWQAARDDRLYTIRPERNDGPLTRLEQRVGEQNARLRHWRAVRDRVIVQSEAMAADGVATPEPPMRSLSGAATPVRDTASPSSRQLSRRSATISGRATSPPATRSRTRSAQQAARSATPESPPQLAPDPGSPTPHDPRAAQASQIVASVLHAAPTPAAPRTSLAERTRLSLAQLTPSAPPFRAAPVQASPSHRPGSSGRDASPPPKTPDRFAGLAERTRQSMALAASGARSMGPTPPPDADGGDKPALRRKSRMSRISNVYPVNQFETPRKGAMAAVGMSSMAAVEEQLDERLEEFAVDEAAAFASRPRVAASPPPVAPKWNWSEDADLVVRDVAGSDAERIA